MSDDLVERLTSHMGLADMGQVLADCRLAATRIEAQEAEIARLKVERDTYLSNWKEARFYLVIESNHTEQAESRANHLESALAKAVEVRDLLQWFSDQTHLELSFSGWDETDVWNVHSVTGGRNDREWNLIASGKTPTDALKAARDFVKEHDKP